MSGMSSILFLSGAFTIYVAICLFLDIELLGGILRPEGSEQDELTKIYFNSYIHMFVFASGITALIIAILGCCASKVNDKCCITCFSVILIGLFLVFTAFGIIMIAIHL